VTSPQTPRARSRQVSSAGSRIDLTVGGHPTAPQHEVTIVDGRFTIATCSCGWSGSARRHRAAARAEAHDHALLYADGSGLGSGTVDPSDREAVSDDAQVEVDLRATPSV
jgi:hypothetical protein